MLTYINQLIFTIFIICFLRIFGFSKIKIKTTWDPTGVKENPAFPLNIMKNRTVSCGFKRRARFQQVNQGCHFCVTAVTCDAAIQVPGCLTCFLSPHKLNCNFNFSIFPIVYQKEIGVKCLEEK